MTFDELCATRRTMDWFINKHKYEETETEASVDVSLLQDMFIALGHPLKFLMADGIRKEVSLFLYQTMDDYRTKLELNTHLDMAQVVAQLKKWVDEITQPYMANINH
jgi:hypothetical protein